MANINPKTFGPYPKYGSFWLSLDEFVGAVGSCLNCIVYTPWGFLGWTQFSGWVNRFINRLLLRLFQPSRTNAFASENRLCDRLYWEWNCEGSVVRRRYGEGHAPKQLFLFCVCACAVSRANEPRGLYVGGWNGAHWFVQCVLEIWEKVVRKK